VWKIAKQLIVGKAIKAILVEHVARMGQTNARKILVGIHHEKRPKSYVG
jgi:hypothetical protein